MKKFMLLLLLTALAYMVYTQKLYQKIPLPGRVSGVSQGLAERGKQALSQGRRALVERGADALKSGRQMLGDLEKDADPCRLRMVSLAAHLDRQLQEAGDGQSFTSKYLFGNLSDEQLACPEDGQRYELRLFRSGSGYDFTITCKKKGHQLKSADFRSGAWQAWVKG